MFKENYMFRSHGEITKDQGSFNIHHIQTKIFALYLSTICRLLTLNQTQEIFHVLFL